MASRIVLVTGALGLIGKATTRQLRGCDDNFVISTDKEKVEDASNYFPADISIDSDLESLLQVVKRKVSEFESVSFSLVHLAAKDAKVGGDWSALPFYEQSIWREYSAINQESLLALTDGLIKLKYECDNISKLDFIFFPSLYNLVAPKQDMYGTGFSQKKPFYYIGTKALIRDLSRYINSTFSLENIFSNCIIPHLVVAKEADDSSVDRLSENMLTKNRTQAEDVAKAISFMVDRPDNMIGVDLVIDGGWTTV